MNKTEYKVRHIRCNMADFNMDRHRFRFEYNDLEYIVSCIGSVSIFFDKEDELPIEVKESVTKTIYKKIDNNEFKKWRYPEEAYAMCEV